MAPHSNTLAWKIPWTEEPGRLQAMGSRRVGHDWATSFSLFTFKHWRRKWQPTPVFLPGGSQGRGSRCAAVYGVAQSPTQLRRLSSSCSSNMLAPIVFSETSSQLCPVWAGWDWLEQWPLPLLCQRPPCDLWRQRARSSTLKIWRHHKFWARGPRRSL